MKAEFESIYASNSWLHGSGEGSMPLHVKGYMKVLQNFLKTHEIRRVLDLGCGDWQFSQLLDWDGILYTGIDVVGSVVERNQELYSRPNIQFMHTSGDFDNLPVADLLIVKDVMQHWSNHSILSFLPILRRYSFALVTNCVNPHGPTINKDIHEGEFRYLDIRLPPFNVPAEEMYSFEDHRSFPLNLFSRPRWRKRSLLLRSQSSTEAR